MIQPVGLLILHIFCLYCLWLLWNHKETAFQRGVVLTKMGHIGTKQSPCLFYFSIWVDFIVLAALYVQLIGYSIAVIMK